MRILAILFLAAAAYGQTARELVEQLSRLELDASECYRVRDVNFQREDLRFYLTDGYLIFSKPLMGIRPAAVFLADTDGGDAEIILLPPNKGERRALAAAIKTPNLSEHFNSAVFVMSDGTDSVMLQQIRERGEPVKSLEKGLLIASDWNAPTRNISSSFETRLVLDLMSGTKPPKGLFFAALNGVNLGGFDVISDQRGAYQIIAGKTAYREERPIFDVWTMFPSRSQRKQPDNGDEYQLSDYRIEATLEPPDLRMSAVTRFQLKLTKGTEHVFPFDISRMMRVVSVAVDGKPAEVLQRESMRSNLIRNNGNELFLVIPQEPFAAGRKYEVEIRHEGAVVNEVDRQVYLVTSRGNWYPSRGVQFSTFDLKFRYPKEFQLVAAGDLISEQVQDAWKTSHYRSGVPIRIAGFNLGVYEKTRVERKGIQVDVYANQVVESALRTSVPRHAVVMQPPPSMNRRVRPEIIAVPEMSPPPNPKARLNEVAADVASALEFFSAILGPPPLKTLTVSPVPGAFGQGFPGLVYMSTMAYLGPSDRPISRLPQSQQIFFSELLYAHEVAHQWWGNIVTAATYQDEWLMEALANYSAMMQLEKRKGAKALGDLLAEYRSDLLAKRDDGQTVDSTGPIALGMRLLNSQTSTAWRTITYEKGSWILHMLRRRMGDAAFMKMLGALRTRFEAKPLNCEDFRMVAASFLPAGSPDPKLEAFFDQWVYSTGIPELEFKYFLKGKAPAIQLTGTLKQSGLGEDAEILVPVELQFGRGKSATHWIRASTDGEKFTLRLPQMPAKVNFAPGEAVLAVKK